MKLVLKLILSFVFLLAILWLPFTVYYILAANFDIPEETAEMAGGAIYIGYFLIFAGLVGKACWRWHKINTS